MRLQGLYRNFKEIKASDVRPGLVLAWNYGYTSEVLSVEKCGKKSIYVTTKCLQGGTVNTRRFLLNRVLALA